MPGMAPARGQLRTIEPIESVETDDNGRLRRRDVLKSNYRPIDSDFFCWKYGVWYNLMDCCYRHFRKTYTGCAGCGQGANNLKVNRGRFLSSRHLGERPRFGR